MDSPSDAEAVECVPQAEMGQKANSSKKPTKCYFTGRSQGKDWGSELFAMSYMSMYKWKCAILPQRSDYRDRWTSNAFTVGTLSSGPLVPTLVYSMSWLGLRSGDLFPFWEPSPVTPQTSHPLTKMFISFLNFDPYSCSPHAAFKHAE